MADLFSSVNIGALLFALALLVAAPGLFFIARAAGIDEQIGSRLLGTRKQKEVSLAGKAATPLADRIGEVAKRALPTNVDETNAIRFRLLRARHT
ncbi:MAG: hypothetical protein AAFO57_08020, partial [Pseudomonadota bacterium]